MPHSPKPFWRQDRQRWMVELDGKPVTLGPQPEGLPPPKRGKKGHWNPPQAILDEFRRLQEERVRPQTPPPSGNLVAQVLDDFLDWCGKHRKPDTYESYQRRIQSFLDYLQSQDLLKLSVEELRPFHVREWADSHVAWNPGMKRGRMMAIQTALNWALEEGKIERSPIIKLKKPSQGKRDTVISLEEYQRVLGFVRNHQFRDLLACAWESGARPQELIIVEARHFQDGTWVFPPGEAKGGNWRVVYPNDTALAVVRRLNAEHPAGPIFLNTEGVPWTPFSINCTFGRLKKKLGRKYCLYNFRHSWATEALKVHDPVTVSVLMGHADTGMLARVYQHLSQDQTYLRNAAQKVRPGGASA